MLPTATYDLAVHGADGEYQVTQALNPSYMGVTTAVYVLCRMAETEAARKSMVVVLWGKPEKDSDGGTVALWRLHTSVRGEN